MVTHRQPSADQIELTGCGVSNREVSEGDVATFSLNATNHNQEDVRILVVWRLDDVPVAAASATIASGETGSVETQSVTWETLAVTNGGTVDVSAEVDSVTRVQLPN